MDTRSPCQASCIIRWTGVAVALSYAFGPTVIGSGNLNSAREKETFQCVLPLDLICLPVLKTAGEGYLLSWNLRYSEPQRVLTSSWVLHLTPPQRGFFGGKLVAWILWEDRRVPFSELLHTLKKILLANIKGRS